MQKRNTVPRQQDHPMIKLYEQDTIHDKNLVGNQAQNYKLESLREMSVLDFSRLMVLDNKTPDTLKNKKKSKFKKSVSLLNK